MPVLSWATAPRRIIVAWALYDWAAQPFFTVVLTFIFGPYFQNFVAPDAATGQAWWGYGTAAAGIIVALTGPGFGAAVDRLRQPVVWLVFSMVLMSLGLSVTWFALPGASALAPIILGGIVLAGAGAEYGIIITNAMMPSLVAKRDLGKLSGFGWAMGYVGGLALLCLVLFAFVFPQEPAFGLDKESHAPDRIVGPLSILWLWAFSLPLLKVAPRLRAPKPPRDAVTLTGILKAWRSHKNVIRFLLSRMLYYDGVTAVFVFGGLYAAGTLGWQAQQLGVFGIILIVAGAIGTALAGRLEDVFGSKRTISVTLFGIIFAVLGIVSIEPERILFVIPVEPHIFGSGFASASAQAMLGFGLIIGLFLGPVQSASRALMARISPPDQMTTFFGLYAFTGRATAFLAPLSVAIVTDLSGSRRVGISVVIVLMVAGFMLLRGVKEQP
ncbi:MAG: MFS transporter [Pseudomonadota bacterium]